MKIISLKMNCFGPFKNEERIDFSKLGKEGVYLISGKTGAGKTSIFDAVSYALFGTSSGGDRDEKMLRFSGATPKDDTYVELEFEYRNKRYTINRSPSYLRNKKRGDGLTEKSKTAFIKFENNELIEGNSEVDAFIKQLLGVDANQFGQIVMLAQGNFMKLLKASSSEKLNLFRNIFNTQKYNELEKYIGKKFSEKKLEKDIFDSRYKEILLNIKVLDEDLEEFNNSKYSIDSVINFIKKINDRNNNLRNLLDKEIEELNDKKNKKNSLMIKVEDFHNIKNENDVVNRKISDLEPKYKDIKEKYKNISKIEDMRYKYEEDIRLIKLELNQFEKLEEILKNKEELLSKLSNIEKSLNDKLDEKNEVDENIKKYKTHIETHRNDYLEKEKKENVLEKLILKEKELDKIILNLNTRKSLEDNRIEKMKLYKDKNNEHIRLYEEYMSIDKKYFESQVGVIAKSLIENEPCPVCGSLEHPNIHKINYEIPDEIQVKNARKNYEKSKEDYENIKADIKILNNNIERINIDILEALKSLNYKNLIETDIDNEKTKIRDEIKVVEKEIKDLKLNIDRIKYSEDKLSSLDKNLIAILNDIEIFKNTKIRLEEQKNSILKQEETEKKSIGNKDKSSILSTLYENEKNLENIKIELEEIRKNYDLISNDYSRLQASSKILQEKLNEKFNLNLDDIKSSISELINSIKSKTEELSKLIVDISKKEEQLLNLEDIKVNQDILSKEYINYSDLNDVLKGNISGIANIRFETFVQIRYFEEILVSANKRFHDMTNGKFSLQRKKGANNLSEQSGLEFEVVDHYNKTERNINTLSGGESFQAALSLALGLSDIVQMQSGGINLESMFVDEGFGTLDSETLSTVMNSLMDISKYNKLIGIISHVESLKSQIDKQIIVTKNQEGYSKIDEIIY